MTSPRSMFTEAIEDHLALKKANAPLNDSMELAKFDVGDPLDRYPGGPVKPVVDVEESASIDTTPIDDGRSEAGEAVQRASADILEGSFRQPLEPLNGMTPMLSLVEDLDEDDVLSAVPSPVSDEEYLVDTPEAPDTRDDFVDASATQVLRFPGGVGPRDVVMPAMDEVDFEAELDEAADAQPVIVIDAEEPLAPPSFDDEPFSDRERKRPSFFGLRRGKKKSDSEVAGSGWFAGQPKEFTWDD